MWWFYILMVAGAGGALWIALHLGAGLQPLPSAGAGPSVPPPPSGHANVTLTLILQLFLILALSRLMGWVFRFFRQPQVMGEMIAGIMLGPSVFKAIAPHTWAAVFPADGGYLNVLSQIGVIFFLFLIGLELDPKLLRNRGHSAVIISHVSIVAPFVLGAILSLYLFPRVFIQSPRMNFTSVALFMGAAMSITAFPVLARILTERNLHRTPIGAVAITCAAVDDVTAWCMLAFVVGVARANGLGPGLATAGWSVLYVLIMFFVVRPFLRRLQLVYDRQGRLSQPVVAAVFLLTLASSFITEHIGIHALFGAFLMGAMMPKGTKFVAALTEKLEDFTVIFLLPIFFAYTGLRTEIGLLNSPSLWVDTGLIIFVACLGKFGGSAVAGRACGMSWTESSVIGILMNTRGLMELVILNIGLQEGVIPPTVFAMMVLMALVTTALTTPVLHWLFPHQLPSVAAAGEASGFRVLLPVSLPVSGPALARMAKQLIGPEPDAGNALALHLRRPEAYDAFRIDVNDEEASMTTLTPLLAEATKQSLKVEPVSFVSRTPPEDIAAVAKARRMSLVLMGFHKPVFQRSVLGGAVRRVLDNCENDVAIFIDHNLASLKRILVPYRGSPHDRLALELASRLQKSTSAHVTILHIVDPQVSATSLNTRGSMEQAFTSAENVELKVVESNSPVDAVLKEAPISDLLIIGMDDEWGLEPRYVGLRPERIVRECPTSLLVVRRVPKSAAVSAASPPIALAQNPVAS